MPPSVSLPYFGMQHTPPAPYRHELPSSIGSSVHYHATPHNYFLDPLGRPYMYNPTTQTVTNRPNSAPSSHRHHTTPQPADEWRQDELLEDALTIGPAPVDYGFGYGPRRAADEKPAGFVRMIVTPPRASSRPPVLHRRPQYQYELEHKPATARKSVTRDEHNHRILAFKNQPREDVTATR
ncbi:hypothetical protein MMC34_008633, partial [Xylographa carneopallida]|nr:hypothetical protein [Xylographa carneopallida]